MDFVDLNLPNTIRSLGADPMESMASDWSSTSESESSSENDDEPEEQETQSTIEPLSPDFRGRADRKRSEDGKEDEEGAIEEDGSLFAVGVADCENEDSETPRISRGGVGDVGPYFRKSSSHRLSKNDSSEHLLGGKSSMENSPADSPLKKTENLASKYEA